MPIKPDTTNHRPEEPHWLGTDFTFYWFYLVQVQHKQILFLNLPFPTQNWERGLLVINLGWLITKKRCELLSAVPVELMVRLVEHVFRKYSLNLENKKKKFQLFQSESGSLRVWPGSNYIELLSKTICLAWNFFHDDKNRITNQTSIFIASFVAGIQLLWNA